MESIYAPSLGHRQQVPPVGDGLSEWFTAQRNADKLWRMSRVSDAQVFHISDRRPGRESVYKITRAMASPVAYTARLKPRTVYYHFDSSRQPALEDFDSVAALVEYPNRMLITDINETKGVDLSTLKVSVIVWDMAPINRNIEMRSGS